MPAVRLSWRLSSLLVLASSSPRGVQSFAKHSLLLSQQQQQQRHQSFFVTTTGRIIQQRQRLLHSNHKNNMSSSSSSSSLSSSHHHPSVSEFLKTIKADTSPPPSHVSIGNPAGDADSIISAIAIAYIHNKEPPCLPIVSIPILDLKRLRPETKYLLELAGIDDVEEHFVAIDTLADHTKKWMDESDNNQVSITLVDHNKLTISSLLEKATFGGSSYSWTVTEILDHHLDEGAHMDTCPPAGQLRNIAFDSQTSAALVASTCTLIVERWLEYNNDNNNNNSSSSFPPTLAILLLGVILLDSINLSPAAGKVTQRDVLAVEALQSQTNWKSLTSFPDELWKKGGDELRPDPKALFETLQNQKFRPAFWQGLSALQALNLDYKSFTVSSNDDGDATSTTTTFGMSSILQTMADLFGKEKNGDDVLLAVQHEMTRQNLKFFALMCCDFSGGKPKRQLVTICPNKAMSESLLQFLKQEGTLQLDIVEEKIMTITTDGGLHAVLMEQGNAKASRKQVAPIFMEYFASPQASKL